MTWNPSAFRVAEYAAEPAQSSIVTSSLTEPLFSNLGIFLKGFAWRGVSTLRPDASLGLETCKSVLAFGIELLESNGFAVLGKVRAAPVLGTVSEPSVAGTSQLATAAPGWGQS